MATKKRGHVVLRERKEVIEPLFLLVLCDLH